MNKSTTQHQRKALLIGCQLGSLSGVATDLSKMKAILQEHRFTCTVLPSAKKQEIINTWRYIIKDLSEHDAVVIYYSGHGGMVERRGRTENGMPHRPLQYLMPIDFHSTTATDWRGITDIELAAMLRDTTRKTKNTTVILDCCHAARMARLPGVAKTINPTEYQEVYDHITKMWADGRFAGTDFHHERNPDAIVIAASPTTESAYEQQFNGVQRSVLTEAFEAALRRPDGVGANISWRTVMLRIRDRLKVTCPQQYPHVEGDDLRMIFSLERAAFDAFPVEFDPDGNLLLAAGQLHGVERGDRYSLVPSHVEHLDSRAEIEEVAVEGVGPSMSGLSRRQLNRQTADPVRAQMSTGVKALLKQRQLGKLPVALEISNNGLKTQFSDYISRSNFVALYRPGISRVPAVATIRELNGHLQLIAHEPDRSTLLQQWGFQRGDNQRSQVEPFLSKLESLARSRHLLSVAGMSEISGSVEVDLRRNNQQLSGETWTMKSGDRFHIAIKNTGDLTVYVSIFDVCAGAVGLLSTASPSGRRLQRGESYCYGRIDYLGNNIGSEIKWPEGVPAAGKGLLETIVVVITDHAIDLRGLETNSSETRGASEFASLIEGISTSTIRDVERESNSFIRFGVLRYTFVLEA